MLNTYIKSFNSHRSGKLIIPAISSILGVICCVRYAGYIIIPLPVLSLLSLIIILSTNVCRLTRYCLPLSAFLIYYGISLVIHPYPEPLLRISRYVAFAIGLLLFSPLLMSKNLTLARKYIFASMFWTLLAMVLMSFLLWIYCVIAGYAISDSRFYYYGFKGIFDNGMVLSPAAGFIALISFHKSLTNASPLQIVWFTIAIISLITCVSAGSRITALGTITAMTVESILMRKRIKETLSETKPKITIIAVSLALVAIFPTAYKVIAHKNSIGHSHNSLIYSRQEIWTNRVNEICTSPLIGIGYANELTRESDCNESGKLYNLEPGSSWLSLASYGGIIGLGLFCWYMYDIAHKAYAGRHIKSTALTISLLTFFFINGVAEGWLMFSGSLMFPLFWMTCSLTTTHSQL